MSGVRPDDNPDLYAKQVGEVVQKFGGLLFDADGNDPPPRYPWACTRCKTKRSYASSKCVKCGRKACRQSKDETTPGRDV